MAEEAIRTEMQGERPLEETVVKVFRNAKVVKGGRRFSFSALVVVGDRNGSAGYGYAKANEVPPAVEKAIKDAKRSLKRITVVEDTIPHEVMGKCRATSIVMLPASPGTGVIAGASARAVLEAAGVRNVLTKIYGSRSAKNVVKAVMNGLLKLRSRETIASIRGVEIETTRKW